MLEVYMALDEEEWNLNDMRSVLQQDASGINVEDDEGRIPLYRVLRDNKCSADIVQLLLDYGARVPNSDIEFLLPNFINESNCKKRAEVVSVLLKAGACTSHDSLSTLCFAIRYDADDDIIKVLLDAGLLNKCNHHSFLPLICATEQVDYPVRIRVFQLLLEAGAHPDVRSTYDGGTPLHKVLCSFFYESDAMMDIMGLLIENGAQIDAVDNSGNTPLHTAVSFYETAYYPTVDECLLKKGSPIDKRNKGDQTPLEVAVTQPNNHGIIELLFSAGSALGVKRDSTLCEVLKKHLWEEFIEDRLRTFFKYYFLEEDSTFSEVDGLIAGHEKYEELSHFTSECVSEIQKMGVIRVCRGRYSLLEFVRMFTREKVNFNREIIDCGVHLMKVLSDNALPWYFEVVVFKVKWFFERKTLEKQLLYVGLSTFCKGVK